VNPPKANQSETRLYSPREFLPGWGLTTFFPHSPDVKELLTIYTIRSKNKLVFVHACQCEGLLMYTDTQMSNSPYASTKYTLPSVRRRRRRRRKEKNFSSSPEHLSHTPYHLPKISKELQCKSASKLVGSRRWGEVAYCTSIWRDRWRDRQIETETRGQQADLRKRRKERKKGNGDRWSSLGTSSIVGDIDSAFAGRSSTRDVFLNFFLGKWGDRWWIDE